MVSLVILRFFLKFLQLPSTSIEDTFIPAFFELFSNSLVSFCLSTLLHNDRNMSSCAFPSQILPNIVIDSGIPAAQEKSGQNKTWNSLCLKLAFSEGAKDRLSVTFFFEIPMAIPLPNRNEGEAPVMAALRPPLLQNVFRSVTSCTCHSIHLISPSILFFRAQCRRAACFAHMQLFGIARNFVRDVAGCQQWHVRRVALFLPKIPRGIIIRNHVFNKFFNFKIFDRFDGKFLGILRICSLRTHEKGYVPTDTEYGTCWWWPAKARLIA